MENMEYEIVKAIESTYKDDKDLIKDCLYYLNKVCNSTILNRAIEDWFDENEYCIHCGCKLETKMYEEIHTELDGNPTETIQEIFCPYCSK